MARKGQKRRAVTRGPVPRIVYRAPTGLLVWALPGSDHLQIMWAGPGARLRMGFDVTKTGSPFPGLIHHPGADGEYTTAKEATAAVARFLADHAAFTKDV